MFRANYDSILNEILENGTDVFYDEKNLTYRIVLRLPGVKEDGIKFSYEHAPTFSYYTTNESGILNILAGPHRIRIRLYGHPLGPTIEMTKTFKNSVLDLTIR